MSDNIKEDVDGEYGMISTKVERYLDAKGQLTKEFIDELKEFKEEELLNLEESIKNARQPNEDMFGIKRRFCSVCQKGCIGYEPLNMIIPNGGTNMTEFPTFCKNCKCPAYFHQVVFNRDKDLVFPPELSETVKNHNIMSKDVNFNCVLLVFQVRDTENYQNNLNELLTIIKEEGLEVLQLEKRDLDIEEAIYFKTRMVGQAETQLSKLLGIHQTSMGKQTNIRQEAYQGSSMHQKIGAKDPYIMNQYADEKERKLQKMQQTMVNQKSNQNIQYIEGVTIKNNNKNDNNQNYNVQNVGQSINYNKQQQLNAKVQQDKGLLMESINQRVPINFDNPSAAGGQQNASGKYNNQFDKGGNAPSIARTSNLDSVYNQNLNNNLDSLNMTRRETVLPQNKDKYFKVKTFTKTSGQIKKSLKKKGPQDIASQELYFTQQVENNPLLRELITKDALILAVGSTTFQNLDRKLKQSILPKVQQFVPPYEMPMLYLSDNKILALEDTITFFPSLFKLTKSIVVTEQLIEFNNYFNDVSTYAQVQLGQMDPNSKKLNEKLQSLMSDLELGDRQMMAMQDPNRDMQDELEENEDEGFYRNRKTLTRKISSQLKETIIKRETIINMQQSRYNNQNSGKLNQESKDDTILEWIEKSKQHSRQTQKKQRLLTKKNKNLYNYGIMQDFFAYSAMCIQNSLKEVDIDYQKLQQSTSQYNSNIDSNSGANQLRGNQNLANIYAIAKTGLSNLILPNALDVKLSNYNNYVSYIRMSDMFFPDLSKSQYSVLVMRPIIVKNGLNEMFIQILKVNDFTIIKRKIRMLTKAEVLYMAEVEKITKDKAEMYYNLMMSSDVEIVVVSKLGAVSDLQSLVDGCKPYGRRRIPQLFEDIDDGIRSNVDSINGMFEITPFTSFSEFIDLEDFIVGHTRLEKYKKLYKQTKQQSMNRLENQLYFYKIEQIRKELNLFQRFFNLSALAAPSTLEAQKSMCILMPEVATIEESVIILNPLYNTYYEQANRLLERMGFRIIKHKLLHIRPEEVQSIFQEKLSNEYIDYTQKLKETLEQEQLLQQQQQQNDINNINTTTQNQQQQQQQQTFFQSQSTKLLKTFGNQNDRLTDLLSGTQVHMFHICKISGDREIRQLYKDSQIEYEDLFKMKVKTTPFKPAQFPLLFIFMDTPLMFEESLKVVYPPTYVEVTGSDFQDTLKQSEKFEVLNNALISTLGDEIKHLIFDKEGNILNGLSEEQLNSYVQTDKIPQVFQLYSNPKGNHAIHFLVESESHGLYEIRFQRLPHRGDYYSEANDSDKVNLNNLKVRYFTKFQTLNFYYNEVNKRYYNICPAFYRFKICPLITTKVKKDCINRVYEVEEYMGKLFIEDLSNQHQDHIRMQKQNRLNIGWQHLTEEQQQSLPPYIWGVRISQTVKDLEKIVPTNDQVQGCGKIKFEKGNLKGQCEDPRNYFQMEKQRYKKMLSVFKNGWGYYLNVIDQEIIQSKLKHILKSFTFKYSRQPGMMALIPDRVTETNLRISEKIKFLIPEGLDRTNKEKFFTHLKEDVINEKSENLRSHEVQSVLHALHVANVKKTLDLKFRGINDVRSGDGIGEDNHKSGTSPQKSKTVGKSLIIDQENVITERMQREEQKFSVHKDVAIVGCEVAVRTKYQLIASILYLFNFWYRKVERRTEFFEDIERQFIQKYPEGVDPEKDYDQILDIIVRSIQENYGDDEYNLALDMAKLNQEEESEFEKNMREKHEKIAKQIQRLEQRTYEQHRLMRTTMSIEKLIATQCNIPQDVYDAEQRRLLKKFVESKGHNDSAGEGFLQLLNQSESVRYGPYSIKLAYDYLKRFEKAEKSKSEKISFVKMEYFLYGFSESYRIVEELRAMESKLVSLLELQDIKKREAGFTSGLDNNTGTYKFNVKKTQAAQSMGQNNTKLEVIQDLEKKIDKIRHQIASKEAELVLSFRELCGWDYMVPDHYFDVNHLIKMKNMKAETYTVPFRTFWRPINIEGVTGVYEPELTMEKFALRIRDYSDAPRLKLQSLYREPDEPTPQPGKPEGALISYLRPYNNRDPSDYLRFDKYYSMGEWKQYKEITQVRDIIKEKTTKMNFTYGDVFTKKI